MRRIQALISLLLILFLLPIASAADQSPHVLVIRSSDATLYARVEKALKTRLGELCRQKPPCPSIRSLRLSDIILPLKDRPQLLIALGKRASDYAARKLGDIPQLHAMVSRMQYAAHPGDQRKQSAIYLEQPLERQLAFIRFLMPERHRIGVLLSGNGNWAQQRLRSVASKQGFDLLVREVDSPRDIGKKLHTLKNSVDVLLALPDPSIYNRKTLPSILLTSYRDGIPVIGFSAGLVRAGAIGGVYSSPATIGTEVAERSIELLHNGKPRAAYPSHMETGINRQVAAALHIRLPTNREIDRWREGL